MSKQFIPFYFLLLFIGGCATMGRQTLYKSDSIGEIQKIGVARLEDETIIDKLYPQADSIFNATVLSSFAQYSTKSVQPINKEFSTSQPDTAAIRDICRENNLDCLLVSNIKFINITYTMLYVLPIDKDYDTDVEMKLFDRNAHLLLNVRYKTLSNHPFGAPPGPDKAIRNGVQGVMKRLAKELGWIQ